MDKKAWLLGFNEHSYYDRKTMKREYKTIKYEMSGFMGGNLDAGKLDEMMNELGQQD